MGLEKSIYLLMKTNSSNNENIVPYDDNNIRHVLAGPDYGQTWSYPYTSSTWDEFDSTEWEDYVDKVLSELQKSTVRLTKKS
jgi:hypothetical protein